MGYTFRLMFHLSGKVQLNIEENSVSIIDDGFIRITLQSHKGEQSIKKSEKLVLLGVGYESAEKAKNAGELCRDGLIIAFAKSRFPADFGDRTARSFITDYGLKIIEEQTQNRVLNDTHGLQVYETGTTPIFASSDVNAIIGKPKDQILEQIKEAISHNRRIYEKRRVAYELFTFSFFTNYIDSRFILLFMAIEILIEPSEKGEPEIQLIDKCIKIVNESSIGESLIGGLTALKRESIGAAARRVLKSLPNKYLDMDASTFFNKCYKVRNQIAHGTIPRPNDDISNLCGPLEFLVADLISNSGW